MRMRPKKRLGQNFLVDKNIQAKIVAACNFKDFDTVLEIGSGRGELTRLIAKSVRHVYAVELDSALCNVLTENIQDFKNITVLNQDILKFNLKKFFCKSRFPQSSLGNQINIIGNIPYYIATPIIQYLLNNREVIQSIFLTVQKEFGRRIVSGPGSKEYGSLSCFVQYYTDPRILFVIKNTCFYPAPKVDSCFLKIEIKKRTPLDSEQEQLLFKVIRSAFNKRRKTLRNSLIDVITKTQLDTFFSRYGIDRNIRPENLALNDFINLILS